MLLVYEKVLSENFFQETRVGVVCSQCVDIVASGRAVVSEVWVANYEGTIKLYII